MLEINSATCTFPHSDNWPQVPELTEEDTIEAYLNDFDEEFRLALLDANSLEAYTNPLKFNGQKIEPKFFKDSQGEYMFPPSSTVLIYGEPETGKSFILETLVAEHFGIMVDVERSPAALANRLSAMEFPNEAHARYVFPSSKQEVLRFVERWITTPPTVIGFDAFAGVVSLWGGDTNSDQSIQEIFHDVFHPLRNAGHCVVILDHVGKRSKTKGFSIGSQNKKAQVDISLLLESSGELTITKDRDFIYGARKAKSGDIYGYLEITERPVRAVIHPIAKDLEVKDHTSLLGLTPLQRKQSIIGALKSEGPMSKAKLKEIVGGNTAAFDKAVTQLASEGVIAVESGEKAKLAKCKILISYTGPLDENFAPNDSEL